MRSVSRIGSGWETPWWIYEDFERLGKWSKGPFFGTYSLVSTDSGMVRNVPSNVLAPYEGVVVIGHKLF